jgi:hypothetical protein
MVNGFDTTPVDAELRHCPACDTYSRRTATVCDQCGYDFMGALDANDSGLLTRPLRHSPNRLHIERSQQESCATSTIFLQFLPSGTVVPATVKHTLVLGRLPQPEDDEFINLTVFNGEEHGVSRQHCAFRRRGTALLVTDLGTTNGTYLNGQRLKPHTDHVIVHGDKLILGSLHLIVSFGS